MIMSSSIPPLPRHLLRPGPGHGHPRLLHAAAAPPASILWTSGGELGLGPESGRSIPPASSSGPGPGGRALAAAGVSLPSSLGWWWGVAVAAAEGGSGTGCLPPARAHWMSRTLRRQPQRTGLFPWRSLGARPLSARARRRDTFLTSGRSRLSRAALPASTSAPGCSLPPPLPPPLLLPPLPPSPPLRSGSAGCQLAAPHWEENRRVIERILGCTFSSTNYNSTTRKQ
uniref:Uncharacterized protein LOC110209554 isoform X2 n=1 Tax=Phascolarctos cinereus TaxID=38626 RepID=A0A6P5KFN7_PHACI|nr:uncharacterized protein LOC110209554 isoform X2 [Phascolarctos cinereus]